MSDLLHRQIGDVVQDEHFAFPQRDTRERLAERGEGQPFPGLGCLRPAGGPQQRHCAQRPADPPGGIDGEPHRDLPDPGLGHLVAADPGPARQGPGERLLRDVAVQAQADAGAVRLAGLAGNVTAKAKVGLINATGLSGASVSLTTDGGGITASFTAAPGTIAAVAHVGAIILHVPGQDSYKVSADARVGHADVGVRQSSSSDHVITATTDVGAIKISA